MLKPELLAPAGNREKLDTAFHFGADACYLGGKNFSLRSFADNFDYEQLKDAVSYAHSLDKKIYVTVNIFPLDKDFAQIKEYIKYLDEIKADGVLVTDPGVIDLSKRLAPDLPVHISTQANVTNSYTAAFWHKMGAERVVLARELTLEQIAEIKNNCPDLQLECFVHGAMCISYSGRCLLSSYLTDRDSNRGECVQACRWQYKMTEVSRVDPLEIQEDERGSYILNSYDMNMLSHLRDLRNAGVDSFKIEGRMKTVYYVANVVNAYRRAVDLIDDENANLQDLEAELYKCKNRGYFTGFYYGKENAGVAYSKEQSGDGYDFIAVVLEKNANGGYKIEMRNRFKVGDKLEILSSGKDFNKTFTVVKIEDENGEEIQDAKLVQQRLIVYSAEDVELTPKDVLRRSIK